MTTRFCPQCGAGVSPDDRFCANCGAPVTKLKVAAPEATTRSRSHTNPLLSPLALGLIALVGVVMIMVGLFWNQDRAATLPPTAAAQQPAPTSALTAPPIPFPEVARMSLQEARERLDDPTLVFVDVRRSEDFDASHIPGAFSAPLSGNDLQGAYEELPRDAAILTYCTWPAEELSARAALLMLDDGFSNVSALEGGFGAWLEAGYPTE